MRDFILNKNKIINADCFDVFPQIPNETFDAIILDPPYCIGIDNWDKKIDMISLSKHAYRMTKEHGFVAIFGLFPFLFKATDALMDAGFLFKYNISWVKRTTNIFPNQIKRSKEEIFIFSKSSKSKFFKTEGKYEDVKIDGLQVGLHTLENIKSEMEKLRREHYAPTKFIESKRTYWKKGFSLKENIRHPCKEMTNITDVWYFSDQLTDVWSFSSRRENISNKICRQNLHPTTKPFFLMKRLLELITPEEGYVLDPFSGSGATAKACVLCNMNFFACENDSEIYKESIKELYKIENNLFQ